MTSLALNIHAYITQVVLFCPFGADPEVVAEVEALGAQVAVGIGEVATSKQWHRHATEGWESSGGCSGAGLLVKLAFATFLVNKSTMYGHLGKHAVSTMYSW